MGIKEVEIQMTNMIQSLMEMGVSIRFESVCDSVVVTLEGLLYGAEGTGTDMKEALLAAVKSYLTVINTTTKNLTENAEKLKALSAELEAK